MRGNFKKTLLCVGLCVHIILFETINADAVSNSEENESKNEIGEEPETVSSLPERDSSHSENIETEGSSYNEENTDVAIHEDDGQVVGPEVLGEIFQNGVDAYFNDDWDQCINNFEKGIKSYKKHKRTIADCRGKCKAKAEAAGTIFPYDIEDLQFYDRKIKESFCLMKCETVAKMLRSKRRNRLIPVDVENKYIERSPYEYLHMCYYKNKRYQDAANAVFTFFIIHKKDEQSLKNLRFYVGLPEVVESKIVDLESDPFLAMFKAGVNAYEDKNHLEVIHQLERSIAAYIKAENDCRLYCEGPFDQGWYPDYTMSISNHFVYALKCKQGCSSMLNNVNGEQRYDLLADHYHYLQFAYSKVGKMKEACAAVESYLTFLPSDETVLRNKKYLLALPEVKREYFEPREEALAYVRRQQYEKRLLYYIQNNFKSAVNTTI